MKRKRNVKLDAIKGLACILIIFIHRPFPGIVGNIISGIARSAVALFFVSSGFYSYYDDEMQILQRLPHKIRHTLKLLIYAILFYLIWESFMRWYGSGLTSVNSWITTHILSVGTWYKAVVWDYDPVAGHLWFLFALLRCYLLVNILTKIRAVRYSLIISVVCLLFFLFLQNTGIPIFYYRNGWLYGMGYFLTGYFLAEKREKINDFKYWKILIGIGIIINAIEAIFVANQQMYLGTIIITVAVFASACANPNADNKVTVYFSKIGVKYSMLIYIVHWSIKEIFIKIDKTFAFTKQLWYLWLSPIFLVIVSIISCIIIYQILTLIKIER